MRRHSIIARLGPADITPLPVHVVVAQWLFKSAYEAAATPLTYVLVRFLKRREGVDHYDNDTDFNPFTLKG